jgi:hypothetical protein
MHNHISPTAAGMPAKYCNSELPRQSYDMKFCHTRTIAYNILEKRIRASIPLNVFNVMTYVRNYKQIALHPDTYRRLRQRGFAGQSFNSVVEKLLRDAGNTEEVQNNRTLRGTDVGTTAPSAATTDTSLNGDVS